MATQAYSGRFNAHAGRAAAPAIAARGRAALARGPVARGRLVCRGAPATPAARLRQPPRAAGTALPAHARQGGVLRRPDPVATAGGRQPVAGSPQGSTASTHKV